MTNPAMTQDIKQLIGRAKGYNIAGVQPQVVSDLIDALERLTEECEKTERLEQSLAEGKDQFDHMTNRNGRLTAENARLKAELANANASALYWQNEKELADLRSQQAAVPAGYKLAPVEPTDEMISAYYNAQCGESLSEFGYNAMLAAAPEAPQPSQQEPDWDHPDNRCGGKNCNGNCCKPSQQAEPVGVVGAMPGTAGFTVACFDASVVPVGTKLYTASPSEDAGDAVDRTMQKGGA